MADRVKIGIAGCGAIARQVHIPLLAKRTDVSIVALAESDPHTLVAVRARVPSARAYGSLYELLAEPPDAVIVALPTAAHAEAATAVLEAGCDLYLEKPLGTEVTEALALLDAWRTSGRIGMMGFNLRFNPLLLRLRALLTYGRAGVPIYARGVFATALRDMPDWKRRRATGGGALLDLGSHHIDLMRFLFEREPRSVQASLESRHTEDDTALLELEFDNGPRVHGFYALAAAERDHVEVFGDRARLSVSRFNSLDVDVMDNPGRGGALGRLARRAGSLRHVPGALRARRAPLREPGYGVALDRFIEGVRTRRLPADAPDLADGFACLAVIDAAERSARDGRPASIIPTPQDHSTSALRERSWSSLR